MKKTDAVVVSEIEGTFPAINLSAPSSSSAWIKVVATLAVIAALLWGQRFLIPLVAGLMLAMLAMPRAVHLENWLHSPVAATVPRTG